MDLFDPNPGNMVSHPFNKGFDPCRILGDVGEEICHTPDIRRPHVGSPRLTEHGAALTIVLRPDPCSLIPCLQQWIVKLQSVRIDSPRKSHLNLLEELCIVTTAVECSPSCPLDILRPLPFQDPDPCRPGRFIGGNNDQIDPIVVNRIRFRPQSFLGTPGLYEL